MHNRHPGRRAGGRAYTPRNYITPDHHGTMRAASTVCVCWLASFAAWSAGRFHQCFNILNSAFWTIHERRSHVRRRKPFSIDIARAIIRLNSWPTFSPYLYNRVYSELTCHNSPSSLVHAWVDTSSQECVYFTLRKSPVTSWIKIVSPLSAVNNTRGYARVSHSRQWSNYNLFTKRVAKCTASHMYVRLSLRRRIIHSWFIYVVKA